MTPRSSRSFSRQAAVFRQARPWLARESASATAKELFAATIPAAAIPTGNPPRPDRAGAVPLTDALVFHRVALRVG